MTEQNICRISVLYQYIVMCLTDTLHIVRAEYKDQTE